MAGDWIKMRVWLARDPKVLRMADYLIGQPLFCNGMGFGELATSPGHKTQMRNVTVALCVTGLLVTWGTAREQGDRDGEDLVLRHCTLDTLSSMCEVILFGQAMTSVDWALESPAGTVRFPKFFKDNESPDEKHKRQNADRQARYRDTHSNAARNVTDNVTVTTEKRREENKYTPLENFLLTDELRAWVESQNAGDPQRHYDYFVSYCQSKGKRYKDYRAAFKNAVRGNWAKVSAKPVLKVAL